jgi:tripartite-type tricarboxylate transporter receptor subunit TctC
MRLSRRTSRPTQSEGAAMTRACLPRRRIIVATVAAAALSAAAGRSSARSALRILVGSSPGSVPDIVARRIAERLGAAGRSVVVDNRTGAAGRLAISELRQSPADGTTLLLAPGAVATMYPAIYVQAGYDAQATLLPVSTAAELSLALAVGPAVPDTVTSLAALVDWARAQAAGPGFGSPGVGTPPHVLAALFARRAGIAWTHVPYAGGPPAVNDLLGGRLATVVLPEGLLRAHARQGRLRLLATSGGERSPFTPEVPTFVEQGFADVVLREWFGFFAPAGTPAAAVGELAEDIRRACADPALAATFEAMAIRAQAGEPEQMARRISRESTTWQPLIRAAGITADS